MCTRADRRASLGLVKPDPAKNDMNYVQGSALTGARAAVPMGAAPGDAGDGRGRSTAAAGAAAPAACRRRRRPPARRGAAAVVARAAAAG